MTGSNQPILVQANGLINFATIEPQDTQLPPPHTPVQQAQTPSMRRKKGNSSSHQGGKTASAYYSEFMTTLDSLSPTAKIELLHLPTYSYNV